MIPLEVSLSDGSFDAFISYSRSDREWVVALSDNLARLGITVFRDEIEIDPGEAIVHGLDDGLRHALAGVLVVSPEAMASPWVRNEYAVLMQRAIVKGQRLIPVLYRDAELPPLLSTRLWIDFRTDADDIAGYTARVTELADALRGRPKARPVGAIRLPHRLDP